MASSPGRPRRTGAGARCSRCGWRRRCTGTTASFIPPAKYPAIHNAVLAACDALDGVEDGVLEDPTRCHFDPAVLRCQGADGPSCLTAPQVETARKIYENHGAYPGLAPGSELGWATYGGVKPFAIGDDHFKYVVFGNPAWDYRALDFSDVARYRNPTVDALDPNLKPFFAHGGKLIQYHGWSDPQIPPLHSVDYYRSVVAAMGNVDESYRLFMVPGHAALRRRRRAEPVQRAWPRWSDGASRAPRPGEIVGGARHE